MNREDLLKLAQEIWGKSDWNDAQAGRLERFAALVAAAEREACAKVAEEWSKRHDDVGGYIYRNIRSRGMNDSNRTNSTIA